MGKGLRKKMKQDFACGGYGRKKRQFIAVITVILALCSCITVFAAESAERLPEVAVVVSASRILQDVGDAPVSVSVITRDKIRSSGALNVGDVLRSIPGVVVPLQGALGSAANAQVRGSSSSHVLVLLDGRRINSPQFGGIDLSRIPAAMVERIEVIKGPSSSLYGSDSLAGVINIITVSDFQHSRTTVDVKYGSYDTQILLLDSKGQLGPVGYGLMLESASSGGYRPNSDYHGDSAWGRLAFPLTDRDTLQLLLNYHEGEVGVPGSIQWPEAGRQEDRTVRMDLIYERVLGLSATLNVRGFRDDIHQAYTSPYSSSVHDVVTTGFELQVDQQLGDRHLLTYGGSVGKDHVESTDIAGRERVRKTWGVFAQDVITVTPDLSLTLSNRYDDYSTYGGNLSYRIGVSYNLTANTSTYASYGTGFRAPTLNDMYWVSGGNPNLRPETSKAYEVGIVQKLNGGLVSAAYFHRKVEDLIAWVPINDNDPWEARNVQQAALRGVDLEVERELLPRLTGRAGYMFLIAEDLNSGKFLAGKAKHQGFIGLTYRCSSDMWVDLGVEATGKRFYETGNLPGYAVTNLAAGRALACGATVKLELSNLLDKAYEDIPGYPAPPRMVSLGVSYNF